MKAKIQQKIMDLQQELLDLSHKIHANPELGFEEHQAMQWQINLLKKHGFVITAPYAGLDTAYKAERKLGKGGPRIAFLAEYDALKGLGHGCGHNLIATMAVGAAIGLAAAEQIDGEIIVLGCPAEETGWGKITMLNNGGFKDIDFVMMIHPGSGNIIGRGGLACTDVDIEFKGVAAHSKEPEAGVNALTAMINLFNEIDILRQTWEEGTKINGIITSGGTASNIIPDYAAARFTIRAKKAKYVEKMLDDMRRAANAAALLTGAKPTVKPELIATERYPNLVMGKAFAKNMEMLGEHMEMASPDVAAGSSDFSNISMVIPGIHEYLAIAVPEVKGHTPEFVQASISPRSDEVAIKGAQGLAMTGYDILSDQELRDAIYKEFHDTVPAVVL